MFDNLFTFLNADGKGNITYADVKMKAERLGGWNKIWKESTNKPDGEEEDEQQREDYGNQWWEIQYLNKHF